MISILATTYVKPECRDEYLRIVEELVEKSNAEAGCRGYHLYEDIKEANKFTMIEFWLDQDAIDSHNSSEHFTRIVPQFASMRSKDGEVTLHNLMI